VLKRLLHRAHGKARGLLCSVATCFRWTDRVLKDAPQISHRKDRSDEWTAWCSANMNPFDEWTYRFVSAMCWITVTFEMSSRTANFAAGPALEMGQLGIGCSRSGMQNRVLLQGVRPFESFAAVMTQVRAPLAVNVLDVAQEMHLPRRPIVALSANKVDRSNTYGDQPIKDYSYLTADEKVGPSFALFSRMDFHVTLVQIRSCGLVLTHWTLMYRL
jgi:hypothetical protein